MYRQYKDLNIWKCVLKFTVKIMPYFIVGMLIILGQYFMTADIMVFHQNTESFCNVHGKNVLEGHLKVKKDKILEKMDSDTLISYYQKYVMSKQWKCCYTDRIKQANGTDNVICMDEINTNGHKCYTYTFGLKQDLKFERKLWVDYYCDVFVFDPRANFTGIKIRERVKFHHWGLFGQGSKVTNLTTLSGIRERLFHIGKTIDFLKLNVGSWKWESLLFILDARELNLAKQLILEIPLEYSVNDEGNTEFLLEETDVRTQLKILRKLYDHGFRIFNTEQVDLPLNHTIVVSVSFINSKYFGFRM